MASRQLFWGVRTYRLGSLLEIIFWSHLHVNGTWDHRIRWNHISRVDRSTKKGTKNRTLSTLIFIGWAEGEKSVKRTQERTASEVGGRPREQGIKKQEKVFQSRNDWLWGIVPKGRVKTKKRRRHRWICMKTAVSVVQWRRNHSKMNDPGDGLLEREWLVIQERDDTG